MRDFRRISHPRSNEPEKLSTFHERCPSNKEFKPVKLNAFSLKTSEEIESAGGSSPGGVA